MSSQTFHLVIWIGLAVAVGSAMPNREHYTFPKELGLYLFDWFYATVKIITFNLTREAQKKGVNIVIPPESTAVIETAEAKK
jgi:hypothetical protein